MQTTLSHKAHRNEVRIHGVLARDPEVRTTQSGKTVANFTVATTYEQRTEFHRITAWEQQAQKVAQEFHKGSFIRLVGRLQTRSYEKDGQRKYITEVVTYQIAGEESEPPLTPDQTKVDGRQVAQALLSPAKGASHHDPF